MSNKSQTQEPQTAREITRAIWALTETQPRNPSMESRVLPTLPEFEYRHTCPKCGCHTATALWAQPDLDEPQANICMHCQHVYEHPTEHLV